MTHYDRAILGRAIKDADREDTEAVVVSIVRDDGQITTWSMGSEEGKEALWDFFSKYHEIYKRSPRVVWAKADTLQSRKEGEI